MPNHVTNIIKSSPDVIEALIRKQEDEYVIDFNLIIPCSDSLNETDADGSEYCARYISDPKKNGREKGTFDSFIHSGGLSSYTDRQFENFIKMLRNIREYKVTSWYDWCIKNWGTKWNAYAYFVTDENINNGEIKFETAWSSPLPVIVELSKKFSDHEIEVKYADEDIGSNYGHYIIKNGVVEHIEIDDGILFGINLNGGLEERPWYHLNAETGKYEYNKNYEEQ